MNTDTRTDLSALPPSTPEQVRTMLANAGHVLPEELFEQFLAVWPQFEAMVRRVPRSRAYAEEPAHTYRPTRLVRG